MTVRALGALTKGKVGSESLGRGAGTLRAVGVGSGRVIFQYRYVGADGLRDALPVGFWSERGGDGGLTLADARQKVRTWASRYSAGERDLRRALGMERSKPELANGLMGGDTLPIPLERTEPTFGALLLAYTASLTVVGRSSARAVENALRRHVERGYPSIWALPANEVALDHLVEVVHALVVVGKVTEARKVRSYLRAACSAAMAARQSPSAPAALRSIRLTNNPARELVPVKGGRDARDRALSAAELQAYWHRIASGRTNALLRFHLLTGGQRIEQLGRATIHDWDAESRTLSLKDSKGRRQLPRAHHVPLLHLAVEAMKDMDAGALGPYVFTTTAGRSGVDYNGVRTRLSKVTSAMEKAGELVGPRFTAGDLRRTVETRLAAVGVSMEIRAQLQSHGLSGVQSRHYIRHDFLQEKRDALERLLSILRTGT
jgi:integrase